LSDAEAQQADRARAQDDSAPLEDSARRPDDHVARRPDDHVAPRPDDHEKPARRRGKTVHGVSKGRSSE
jgi:hypothetical protein